MCFYNSMNKPSLIRYARNSHCGIVDDVKIKLFIHAVLITISVAKYMTKATAESKAHGLWVHCHMWGGQG